MKLPAFIKKSQNCCNTSACSAEGLDKIILIGNPNVGKSVIFNSLSDSFAIASNYPGTTVEISSGKGKIGDGEYEVIDTPGMYSLLPITEEERVAQRLLFDEEAFVYLHVIDAKNLRRMLPLTLQLMEADTPLILVLNIMDEAIDRGISIDASRLEQILNIPVVCTVSTKGEGIDDLKNTITGYKQQLTDYKVKHNDEIESAVSSIESQIKEDRAISKRALSLLLLQNDKVAFEKISENDETATSPIIRSIVDETAEKFTNPLNYVITLERQNVVNDIADTVMTTMITTADAGSAQPTQVDISQKNAAKDKSKSNLALKNRIDKMLTSPLTGIPILFLVLYFGLYQFVGVFTAGTIVDYLENTLFGGYVNPWMIENFNALVPYPVIQDLFVGEYGILTQALTYAIALIMPLVGSFFIVFSIIEDTGYLPRLAMLIDRLFKKMGLSGRAVIPMVLGFGCATMATMVTRTLETKREKVIATMLLSLAIPCSAQLGIIIAILSDIPMGLLIWAVVIFSEFIFIGYLAARVLPGKKPSFFMEMPPLRMPKVSNIAIKTYSRMHWYFLEVLPLFIFASILIWIGKLTGLFEIAIRIFEYPTQWIGLPVEGAVMFLFGFFRRDFGAAGLYDMYDGGMLTGVQLVVSAITLTLFMPCIAQFMMTAKERGLKMAFGIAAFIFPFAFLVGFLVNLVLTWLGVVL